MLTERIQRLRRESLNATPRISIERARLLTELPSNAYPAERLEREKLIFRTYDQDNVNIIRTPEKS